MTKKSIPVLLNYLDELFPDAGCELIYVKDYEFAIEVMLSAQTTDIAVNKISSRLFTAYPDLSSLAHANLGDVEEIIHSIGLYKHKAKNVIGIARVLLDEFKGVLPSDKALLQHLPGVGNKSAGVIRAEVFHIPDLAVDTHILRITKRLGIRKEDDGPLETEMILKKNIDQERWIKTHHQLIHFGRYFCMARNPQCQTCKLRAICNKK